VRNTLDDALIDPPTPLVDRLGRLQYGARMLIIAGHLTTRPGARNAFLEAVQVMVDATLEEPGCQEYAFTPDPRNDDRILLYELWDDQESLNGHFVSEHMEQWKQVQPTLDVVGADIKKYTISEVGPVR